MSSGAIKICRIYGIDIEIHWTLLLLLVLALVLSTSSYLLFLIVVALFICVLVHELAHSITAIRNGIRVKEIVLNIIGGASIIDDTNISADVDFRISVTGPLMSFFLAGIFGVLSTLSGPGLLTYFLQLLFELNLLLGIFNILPAFPMDGGRVLRSYLRKSRSDYQATLTTVKVSMYVLGLFVLFTISYVWLINGSLLYKEFNGLILLMIVVFLYGGAQAEKQRATLKNETRNLSIGKLVSTGFVLLRKEVGIAELYRVATEKREHIILTRNGKQLMLVDPFRGRSPSVKNLTQLAIPVASFPPSTTVFDALSMIEATGAGLGVVVSGNRILGVVSTSRIQAFLYLHLMSKRKAKGKRNLNPNREG